MGMRTLAGALVVAAVACGPADVNGTDLDHASDQAPAASGSSSSSSSSSSNGSSSSTAAPTTPSTGTSIEDAPSQPRAEDAGTPAPDSDHDGFPDSIDCAPNDATIAGATLLNDALATDNGFFTVATGFTAGDWSYDAAYTQTRLADAPDLTLFNKDGAITDAIVSVTASSTDISSSFSPELRQMFITFQTVNNGGNVTGVGCGLEVDGTANPTQQTSVVSMSGDPSKVTTTPLNRVARGAVQLNELFQIKATLKAGTLTCDVTIGGNTTTTATANVGSVAGSIGFFTNQTKALFKTANICKLK